MSGWICSYRSIWDHPFFKGNGMRVAIWHWLLHHAAWRPTQHTVGGVKCTIKRGEVCFSSQQIQDDTGASRRQVRDVIDWLIGRGKAVKIGANERANEGAKVRANAKTILVIEKYDEYQLNDSERANEGANEGATLGPTKEQLNNITTLEAKASLSSGDDEKAQVAEAVSLFKEFAEAQEWPTIRILSKARGAALKARLRECGGVEGWRCALEKAAASNHCNGQNERGWVCNFDFLIKQSSFTKLMEGNYDNRTGPSGGGNNPGPSSPHDGLVAGFAAYANSEPRGGGEDTSQAGRTDNARQEGMDCGAGGNPSQPVLRIVHSGSDYA